MSKFLRRFLKWILALFRKQDEREVIGYIPKPGYVWNPLTKHRNIRCPCDSGRKAKHCCGRFGSLPKETARKVTALLKVMDIER